MIKFRARKRVTLIPGLLYANFTQGGLSSYSVKFWRYRWNSKTGRHTFDTPGPGSITWGRERAP